MEHRNGTISAGSGSGSSGAAARVIFALWALAAVGVTGYLLGPHAVAWARSGNPVEQHVGAGTWEATHVLSAGCGCSLRVAESLTRRGAREDVRERVIVVGELEPAVRDGLTAAGFTVSSATADEVEQRYGVQGGPWLTVWGPDGVERYAGGYAGRKISSGQDVRDGEVLDRLVRGERVEPYAAFGCAISRASKRAIDPLGLRPE